MPPRPKFVQTAPEVVDVGPPAEDDRVVPQRLDELEATIPLVPLNKTSNVLSNRQPPARKGVVSNLHG